MTQVFQCHYIRSCIFRINKSYHSHDTVGKYEEFHSLFPHIELNKNKFDTLQKRFLENMRKKKVLMQNEKDKLIEKYTVEKWNKLEKDDKLLHTLNSCVSCKPISICTPPPPKTMPKTTTTPSTPVTPLQALNLSNFEIPVPDTPKSTLQLGYQRQALRCIMTQINDRWDSTFTNRTFSEVLCKCPESDVIKKPTPSEKKKKLRDVHRRVKNDVEKQLSINDSSVLFGTRQSKLQYEKARMSLSFQSKENAEKRVEKRKNHLFIYLLTVLSCKVFNLFQNHNLQWL